MKTEFIERNYKIGKKLQTIIDEKLARLDKYFGEDANARVVASKQGKREKLEITITNKGVLYRGEVESDNMYSNIDTALPKIERQIVRQNEKKKSIDRQKLKKLPFEFIDKKPEPIAEVFKRKTFNLDPELLEEAQEAMERVGHTFYIFLNAKTGKVNVLYRRNDNKLGLIEVNY